MNYELKYEKYKKKYLNLNYNTIGGVTNEINYLGEFKSCDPIKKPGCYEFNGIVFDKNNKNFKNIKKKGYWQEESVNDGNKKIIFTDTDGNTNNYYWKTIDEWHKPKIDELTEIKKNYKIYNYKNIDKQQLTSGYFEKINKVIDKIPITVLSWNICWDCMANNVDSSFSSATELAKKCNDFFIKYKKSCKDNVS